MVSVKILFTIFLSYISEGFGNDLSKRVSGGYDCGQKEFRYLVAICPVAEKSADRVVKCGGSLISGSYVVTAAHCCRGATDNDKATDIETQPQNYQVLAGLEEPNGEAEQTAGVEKCIVHPRYSPMHSTDIALLNLKSDIEEKGSVKFVKLIRRKHLQDMLKGKRRTACPAFTVMGYGAQVATVNINKTESVKHIQCANVDIYNAKN